MKLDYTLLSLVALSISCVFAVMSYIVLYNSTQEIQHQLNLAKKEIEELTEDLNTPRISCNNLELELVAQKKLNDTLQEHIILLEKLEHICEEEELDFQSLTFRVQELEEDCKCR